MSAALANFGCQIIPAATGRSLPGSFTHVQFFETLPWAEIMPGAVDIIVLACAATSPGCKSPLNRLILLARHQTPPSGTDSRNMPT